MGSCVSTQKNSIIESNITPKYMSKKSSTIQIIQYKLRNNIDLKKYLSLKHQLSEYKHKCNDLELQNQSLVLKLNKFLSAHQNWNYQKICEWMTEIDNGIFKPYKAILLKNLKTEDISGKDLCQLEMADLNRLGIASVGDQKLLMSHIKTLTQNDLMSPYCYASQISLRKMSTRLSQIDFDDIKMQQFVSQTDTATQSLNDNSDYRNHKNGVLLIKIIKTIHIKNTQTSEFNYYIQLELKGDYYQNEKTKLNNDKNPIHNQRFQLFTDNPKKDILNIKIWQKNKWIFDKQIGIVCIPVINVLNSDGFINKEYNVKESKYGGKIHLELKYKELLS